MKNQLFWQLKVCRVLVLATFLILGCGTIDAEANSVPGPGLPGVLAGVARNSISKQITVLPKVYSPTPLTLTPTQQNIICTNSIAPRVNTKVPKGIFTEFSLPDPTSEPAGIVKAPDGSFWFIEFTGNRVGRITSTGRLTECPISSGAGGDFITVGPDGKIWFTETNNSLIGRIVITTTSSTQSIASLTEFLGVSAPGGITTGPDGNLWIADPGIHTIDSINTSGIGTAFGGLTGSGVYDPFDVRVGPDNHLWFTEYSSDLVGSITTHGDVLEFTGIPTGSIPEGITVGPDKALWFAEAGSDKIGRIDTQGFFSEPTGNSLPIGSTPSLISTFGDGTLAFTERGSNQIGRTTTSGQVSQFTIPSLNSQPFGIVNSSRGSVWFTEVGTGKIGVLTVR